MKITTAPSPTLNNQEPSFLADGMIVVLFLALANFLLHLYFNNRYGYFRDDFDYMASGDPLACRYVDQPPRIPFLTKISPPPLPHPLPILRHLPPLPPP